MNSSFIGLFIFLINETYWFFSCPPNDLIYFLFTPQDEQFCFKRVLFFHHIYMYSYILLMTFTVLKQRANKIHENPRAASYSGGLLFEIRLLVCIVLLALGFNNEIEWYLL